MEVLKLDVARMGAAHGALRYFAFEFLLFVRDCYICTNSRDAHYWLMLLPVSIGITERESVHRRTDQVVIAI